MRTTRTAVLILTLIAVTLGAYLMAFASGPAIAIPFFAASSFAFLRKGDFKREIPKKDARWTVALLALFLVLMIGCGLMGNTKESNDWFSHWPYRPHISCAMWLLLVFGAYRAYCRHPTALANSASGNLQIGEREKSV